MVQAAGIPSKIHKTNITQYWKNTLQRSLRQGQVERTEMLTATSGRRPCDFNIDLLLFLDVDICIRFDIFQRARTEIEAGNSKHLASVVHTAGEIVGPGRNMSKFKAALTIYRAGARRRKGPGIGAFDLLSIYYMVSKPFRRIRCGRN